jgi:hypothetical protein
MQELSALANAHPSDQDCTLNEIASCPGTDTFFPDRPAAVAGKLRLSPQHFHHRREAPSKPKWASGEITVHPDCMAWAAIRRSKGSRCTSGSLPDR